MYVWLASLRICCVLAFVACVACNACSASVACVACVLCIASVACVVCLPCVVCLFLVSCSLFVVLVAWLFAHFLFLDSYSCLLLVFHASISQSAHISGCASAAIRELILLCANSSSHFLKLLRLCLAMTELFSIATRPSTFQTSLKLPRCNITLNLCFGIVLLSFERACVLLQSNHSKGSLSDRKNFIALFRTQHIGFVVKS